MDKGSRAMPISSGSSRQRAALSSAADSGRPSQPHRWCARWPRGNVNLGVRIAETARTRRMALTYEGEEYLGLVHGGCWLSSTNMEQGA